MDNDSIPFFFVRPLLFVKTIQHAMIGSAAVLQEIIAVGLSADDADSTVITGRFRDGKWEISDR